ncbi:MAG: SMI1/KNR4 family protein [Leptospiraceae bacterium]|jgi:hypothetical protein|nr:SMI1/KNR4 family protein [Leptospiraceae bacterium]PJE04637.1 MAG: cell wall assembly protein [Leptospira sp.]
MKNNFDKLLSNFNTNSSISLEKLNNAISINLPSDYIQFMIQYNGGEGFIGLESYLILWKIDEIISLNEAYEVSEYAPGLILFGSNGGGEAFAFDTRFDKYSIVSIPFVGMDNSLAKIVATNFTDFLKVLNKGDYNLK